MEGQSSDVAVSVRSVSLVIPAYNEAEVIEQAIREADEALKQLGCRYEVLVVDDGSTDGTRRVAEHAAAGRSHVRVVTHYRNRGYGSALRTGFQAATFDRVAFTDADCQFDLSDLGTLLPLSDRHPVAAGYRVDRQDAWPRRFYSWGYNVLVRGLLGTRVRDCDCALKVFRKDALDGLIPRTNGFFANAEMLTRARQSGYTVAEAPVRHRPRRGGSSKVSLREVPRVLGTLLPFWWSRVLFAGDSSDTGRHPERSNRGQAKRAALEFMVLAAIAALLFFSRLRSPLLEPEEARYAEIPRQMLGAGSWVVPILNGQPYEHKPPLLYWLVMGSYLIFGTHDWAARLVPCGAAFLTVLVTYLWGRKTAGARAALSGAFMLALSGRYVYWGRMLTLDSLLAFWVVLAWALAHRALAGARLRWGSWLAAALACGLGVLTKGPVAMILVAVPVIAYRMLDSRSARPGRTAWLTFVALAAGLAAPWYAAVNYAVPGFLGDFLWTHNIRRFWSPLDHQEPVWFFVPGLLLGMLPWTLLVPFAVRFLCRRSGAAARRRPAAQGFYLLAFLWAFVFFSAAGCKRPGYILPAMPPLALALGCYLSVIMDRRGWRWRARVVPAARIADWAFGAALVGGGGLAALATVTGFLTPMAGALALGASAAGVTWLAGGNRRWRGSRLWVACGLAVFAGLFLSIQMVLPAYCRKFSLRSPVRAQLDLAADPRVSVICYPHRWDSVSFYLRRNDVRNFGAEERPLLVKELEARPNALVFVKSDHSLKELIAALPHSLEFIVRGRSEMATAGVVCPRAQAPDTLYAGRSTGIIP